LNQGRWIQKTLGSVAAQTYPRIEHIVVDGGSTDETFGILRNTPGIRWVSEKDRGQADAINKGLSMSAGEIVAFLNSDDLLYPDAVSTAVEHFQRDPSLDILYGDGTVIDEEGCVQWEWLSRPGDFRLLARYHFLWNNSTNYILQPATFWRRSLHERVGLLDESFHYALDAEFWLRAGHAGARMAHVPRKLALFRMIQGTKSLSSPIVFWPDYLELFRRYHGARHIRRYVEQYLYEGMSKAGLSIDEASSLYRGILEGRWADLEETERAVLLAAGLAARGPAFMLLADEAWHRGDVAEARRLRAAAIMYGRRALLRPRSIVHVIKAASGPAAPAVRRLWKRGIDSYRGWKYEARYRDARKNAPEKTV
jgi:glycosyltransferase involved in cell wall biosynthesis